MIWLAKCEFGNMKKSSDWVRQADLDKKLDDLVEQRGCRPAELIPYDAAKALDIEPSGEFYKKVRDWKQRRAAEFDVPTIEVPPHALTQFRATVDRFARDAMNDFQRAVSTVGGDIHHFSALRIADAESRANDAQAQESSLLDHWTAAEAERDAALTRVVELEQALADAHRQEERLTIRLDERDALLKALKPGMTDRSPSASLPSGQEADRAPTRQVPDGVDEPGDSIFDATIGSSGKHSIALAMVDVLKRATTVENDSLEVNEAEQPLATELHADEADGGGGHDG